jgi:hypothetical protein
VLLEDGGEVGLGHVVRKGAVTEDRGTFTRRGQLLVPFDDPEGQWLDLVASDLGSETNDERTRANAVDCFPGNGLLLDWHAEVETELEEQLVEDVRLGPVDPKMLYAQLQRLFHIFADWLPGSDVRAIEFEDTEAYVTMKHRVFFPNLLPRSTETFFRYFGDGWVILALSSLRKLDKDEPSVSATQFV